MGWLNTEKPPAKWSAQYFKLVIERIRTAVNFIDERNFPNGLSGLVLKDKSVSFKDAVYGYAGLDLFRDFFSLAVPHSVNSTSNQTLGAALLWNKEWNTYATAWLEVTAACTDVLYSGHVLVEGVDGVLATNEIITTGLTRHEVQLTALPEESGTLLFKARSTNVSYPLTILSARIILKLT